MDILKIVEEKLKWHPLYSQESIADQVIYAKLFDICGSATWYITEYDPKTKTAFWYVKGLVNDSACDEWGYIDINELAKIYWWAIPRIEVDLHIWIKKFSEIKSD